jgi:peptidoglycan/xylan/chitin deacetylase (PgdA/CDA1 family)
LQELYLTFHGLGTPPPRIDDEERPYWLSPERFSSILRLAQKYETERRRIHITFDDGNQSDVTVAMPILGNFRRQASFFLLSDFLGRPGFVDRDDIARLHSVGMTIGSHGAAHVRWTTLGEAELIDQVTRSLQVLSSLVDHPVNRVAVPFNAYDRRVLSVLRRLGVAAVLTSDGGTARSGAWLKARTTIRMDTSLATIEELMSGQMPVLRRMRFAARRWMRQLR